MGELSPFILFSKKSFVFVMQCKQVIDPDLWVLMAKAAHKFFQVRSADRFGIIRRIAPDNRFLVELAHLDGDVWVKTLQGLDKTALAIQGKALEAIASSVQNVHAITQSLNTLCFNLLKINNPMRI